MIDPRLAEIGGRLEETVRGLSGDPADCQEVFDRYEMVAIQILDCQYMDFPSGELQQFLEDFLRNKQLELGLHILGETP